MGWGGGGHVNVPGTSYVKCSYAAEISGVVATVCTRSVLLLCTLYGATLQRSLVLLLRCVHEGVGWGGVGGHVNVPGTSYALYVATLQRCLVLLLRCVHEGVGWGWACERPCYFVRYMLLCCWDLWCCCYSFQIWPHSFQIIVSQS